MRCTKLSLAVTVWPKWHTANPIMFTASRYWKRRPALDISSKEDTANLARYIVWYVTVMFVDQTYRKKKEGYFFCIYRNNVTYVARENLNLQLKKDNADIAPFPPKRVRNSQPKVLEQRRAALELYIQKMLRVLATKQQVLDFLDIESQEPDASHQRYLFTLIKALR